MPQSELTRVCWPLTILLLATIGTTAEPGQALPGPVSQAPPPVGPTVATEHPDALPPAHVDSARDHPHPPRRPRRTPSNSDSDPSFRRASHAASGAEETCAPRESDVRSGTALVAYLRSVPDPTCINALFDGSIEIRLAAFREEHVIHVAQTAADLSITYDGTSSSGIATFFYFMRAAYYNEFYADDIEFSANVDQAMTYALDSFLRNAHFHDITDEHGFVLREVFVYLDSLGDGYRVRYLPAVRDWFAGFDERHLEHWHLVNATVNVFTWVFRGHWDEDFLEHVLADPERLLDVLLELALTDSLLGVDQPHSYDIGLVVANAAREFARFLEYDSAAVYPMVQDGVRRILAKYDPLNEESAPVWLAAAEHVFYHEVCSDYDICGADKELEDAVLAARHTCSDSVRIRAQDMNPSEMLEACDALPHVETRFHNELSTLNQPLAGDLNSQLEAVVFANWDMYTLYSTFFFGNDTDNGGIYLEGDPSEPSNVARFLAYRADWLEGEPVWNLEHEYVHYLDGRFNLEGSFEGYLVDSHKTIWWLEGLAEWVSRGGGGEPVAERIKDIDGTVPALSDVMSILDFSDTSLYPKSHLAMGFLLDRHREVIRSALDFFRAGDYDGYLDYLNESVGTNYDDEWRSWIDALK